jgi:multidrug efflux pump subunit AcrA (membrane-fusion protein)
MNKRFRSFKYFTQAVILVGLVVLYFAVQWAVDALKRPGHMGILESSTMEMTVETPQGVMPVATEQVISMPFAAAVTYTGTAVAYNDVPVFPRVEGWITRMPVYPGDRVTQGQLLAQLDTRELSSRLSEAELGRQAAERGYSAAVSNTQQAQAQVQRAQQAIQAARANLQFRQAQVQRSRTLVAEDVITREEAQQDESEFETAQSQYNQALSELRAAQRGAEATGFQAQSQRATTEQAATTAQTQRIIRSYTHITAPKSGMIAERLVSPGTLVRPDMQILRLVQIHPIRIQVNVAESDLARIKVGDPVRIWDRRESNVQVAGRVSALFPAANLQTRTAIVEAVIPNSNERFIPGDYVVMAIETGERRNVLSVSNQALVTVDQQKAVWTVQDGKAHLRFVTTGLTDGSRTEIVRGLQAGDVVITQGQTDLQEGVTVASAQYGPQGLVAMPKATLTNRLAPENGYRIRQSVGHNVVAIELTSKPPKVGENELVITVSSPHGGVPDNLGVEMQAIMPAMPTMAVPKPRVQKLGADRFRVTTMFSMPGLWQMELMLKEGNRALGSFKFDTQVPE